MSTRVLISACLVGWRCRYDGESRTDRDLLKKAKSEGWSLVPVCPEVLGGLGVPREPASIIGTDGMAVLKGKARVADLAGRDVTRAFILGAYRTLEIAEKTSCGMAIFKEKSPSCGVQVIENKGKFPKKGGGVTAALLSLNNILLHGRR